MEEIKNDSDMEELLKELEDYKPSLLTRISLAVKKTLFKLEIFLGNTFFK